MKLLFLCNTLYQIIAASCIREMYPNDEAELILSDHSTGHKHIFKKFKETNLIFDKVYYVETKYLYEFDDKISRSEKIALMKDRKTVLSMIELDSYYDKFFCANAEPFSMRLVNYIKQGNKEAEINWFEDGLSAYNYDKCYFPSWKGRVTWKMKSLIGYYGVTSSVNFYYVFQPNKMEWKPNAEIVKIESISDRLAKELGTIFDYENCTDKYEEKYIFFEDGAMDWSTNSDIKLMEKIAELVGRENILVKIHPRNSVNRFKELGFKTNQDTSIPWEIIAANIDIENKMLVTMYSQSVVIPEILLGKNGNVIALGRMEGYTDQRSMDLFAYYERQFFLKNRNRYYVPKNLKELSEVLEKII